MHHPIEKIKHTTNFGTPVVENWLKGEKWLNGSTIRDRSNDPLHHEWMPYHGATSCFHVQEGVRCSSVLEHDLME